MTFRWRCLILSGGPAAAEIGNYIRREPFQGVIDEVAFYDFALTPEEIALHHNNAIAGRTYFDIQEGRPEAIHWQSVTRVTAGMDRVFNRLTGLPKDGLAK